jgi:hypothetical protein
MCQFKTLLHPTDFTDASLFTFRNLAISDSSLCNRCRRNRC